MDYVFDLIGLFFKAVFVENILLAFFLGMCSFLSCSKKVETAHGLGLAVIFVLVVTTPLNYLIKEYLLKPSPINGENDLTYLSFLCFIATIAATVQLVEMLMDKFFPPLYMALGIFLPLISVNCAILGSSLFMAERPYGIIETIVFALGSGVGWYLAIVNLAALRKKIRYSHIPPGLKGLGITFIVTGLMAFCYMGLAGI